MEILGYSVSMTLIWILVAIACGIIEFLAIGFSLGFLGGAIAALVVSLIFDNVWIQIGTFVLVTALFIVFSKRILEQKLKIGAEKTNIESLIGKKAVVTSDIMPPLTGVVKVDAMDWSAISSNKNEVINKDSIVVIKAIEGVKLIVEKER